MTPKIQKKIIISMCPGVQVIPSSLAQAILWYSQKPVFQVKKVFMYGRYAAVSIHKEKIHIHRLLMMWHLRRKLKTIEYVHHKNNNCLDNSLDNLEVLSASKHQSITNKGRKQSAEHVKKRANATTLTRYGHALYEHPNLLEGA